MGVGAGKKTKSVCVKMTPEDWAAFQKAACRIWGTEAGTALTASQLMYVLAKRGKDAFLADRKHGPRTAD